MQVELVVRVKVQLLPASGKAEEGGFGIGWTGSQAASRMTQV